MVDRREVVSKVHRLVVSNYKELALGVKRNMRLFSLRCPLEPCQPPARFPIGLWGNPQFEAAPTGAVSLLLSYQSQISPLLDRPKRVGLYILYAYGPSPWRYKVRLGQTGQKGCAGRAMNSHHTFYLRDLATSTKMGQGNKYSQSLKLKNRHSALKVGNSVIT
jgi:hypothetical protein